MVKALFAGLLPHKNIIIFLIISGLVATTFFYIKGIKDDLLHYEELKVKIAEKNTLIKNKDLEIQDLKERYRNVNIAFADVSNNLFEVSEKYEILLKKNKERDYVKLQEKKSQLTEKIYEKSLNEYYDTFFNNSNGLLHNGNNPNTKP